MGKFQAAKNRPNNNPNHKKRNLKMNMKPNKKQKLPPPTIFEFDDGADSADDKPLASGTPAAIHRLLEPYNKDQLIGFLLDAAASDPAFLAHIMAVADADVAHRKLFIHGLDWEVTREDLIAAFSPFGPVEETNVVIDKATGRSKGYGFVLFTSRSGAVKALEQPQRKIKNRMAYCQLASTGPAAHAATTTTTTVGGSSSAAGTDVSERRIYVSNVHADMSAEKLKVFFSQFGEIESGPNGFDIVTGKSRGFAIFVFKTKEGVKKVLEEPYKMYEGHQFHCKLAFDNKGKTPTLATNAASQTAILGTVQQPGLNAVPAPQNLGIYGQNPAYAALLAQNPLLAAALLNPSAAAAMNPAAAAALHPAAAFNTAAVAALNPAAVAATFNPAAGFYAAQGQALNSLGIGGSSFLGGYGSQMIPGIQGLQSYYGSQVGQSPSTNNAGSYRGFAS